MVGQRPEHSQTRTPPIIHAPQNKQDLRTHVPTYETQLVNDAVAAAPSKRMLPTAEVLTHRKAKIHTAVAIIPKIRGYSPASNSPNVAKNIHRYIRTPENKKKMVDTCMQAFTRIPVFNTQIYWILHIKWCMPSRSYTMGISQFNWKRVGRVSHHQRAHSAFPQIERPISR